MEPRGSFASAVAKSTVENPTSSALSAEVPPGEAKMGLKSTSIALLDQTKVLSYPAQSELAI